MIHMRTAVMAAALGLVSVLLVTFDPFRSDTAAGPDSVTGAVIVIDEHQPIRDCPWAPLS